jgi:hypothetical protein
MYNAMCLRPTRTRSHACHTIPMHSLYKIQRLNAKHRDTRRIAFMQSRRRTARSRRCGWSPYHGCTRCHTIGYGALQANIAMPCKKSSFRPLCCSRAFYKATQVTKAVLQ